MAMKQRCKTESTEEHRRRRYTDRGIKVCRAWLGKKGYERFLAHIGRALSKKHTLDRIDNDKGYAPGNVRWALPKQQSRNRSDNTAITAHGVTLTAAAWCDRQKLPTSTLHNRLRYGFTPEEAVSKKRYVRGDRK